MSVCQYGKNGRFKIHDNLISCSFVSRTLGHRAVLFTTGTDTQTGTGRPVFGTRQTFLGPPDDACVARRRRASSIMTVTESSHTVLSVLNEQERFQGLSVANISFYRPAAPPAHWLPLPLQAIPRHVVQTGSTWSHALRHHSSYMHTWLDMNPEYEYSFFSDAHALRFMLRHGSPHEIEAYRRILTGSQRADLFRVVYLKIAGGVYADLDEELRFPLRDLFGGKDERGRRVPHSSSAVIGSFWPFEFMLYVPHHPIMMATANVMARGILRQVELQRNKSKDACHSPHTCIIRVTGPLAYTAGVGDATINGGCRNKVRTPMPTGQCDRYASDPLLRSMFICSGDRGTIFNSWSCGFARHWDCRNSDRRHACPTKHYARAKEFFDIGRLTNQHA